MEKMIQFGSLVYELEKTNTETGWHMVKNRNATSFWIPDELVREIEHIRIGIDNSRRAIERQQEYLAEGQKETMKKLKEKDNKIDSQRKSIAYYKTDRDAIQRINKKLSNEFENQRKEYKQKIDNYAEMLDSIGESNMQKAEEIDMLKHRIRMIMTASTVIIGTLVLILLLVAK